MHILQYSSSKNSYRPTVSDETAVSVNGADKLSTSGQSIAVHGVLAQYHCYKSLKRFDLSMMNSFCQHVKQMFFRQTGVYLFFNR